MNLETLKEVALDDNIPNDEVRMVFLQVIQEAHDQTTWDRALSIVQQTRDKLAKQLSIEYEPLSAELD